MSDMLSIILGITLYGSAIILLILGIYLYLNRKKIKKKYDVEIFISTILGGPMLTSTFSVLFVFLFGKHIFDAPEQYWLYLIISLVYFLVTHIIYFVISAGKKYKFRTLFIMYAYFATLPIYIVCAIFVSDMKSGNSGTSKAPSTQVEKEALEYFAREKEKDYHRSLKNRW